MLTLRLAVDAGLVLTALGEQALVDFLRLHAFAVDGRNEGHGHLLEVLLHHGSFEALVLQEVQLLPLLVRLLVEVGEGNH